MLNMRNNFSTSSPQPASKDCIDEVNLSQEVMCYDSIRLPRRESLILNATFTSDAFFQPLLEKVHPTNHDLDVWIGTPQLCQQPEGSVCYKMARVS